MTTDDPLTTMTVPYLYDRAAELAIEIERLTGDPSATLTAGQVGAFNQILADSRRAVPNSKALAEDVEEIDASVRPAVAHHALNITIVPTLHNALSPADYEKRR